MKNLLILWVLTLLAVACNPPRDRRTKLNLTPYRPSPYHFGHFPQTPNPDPGSDDGGDKQPTAGEGFSHCQFDSGTPYRQTHDPQLRSIDLCQSLNNELSVALRSSIDHKTRRVCVIPTSRDTRNYSIYIGPFVCTALDANSFRFVTLSKYPSHQEYRLNGAMFLFEDRINSYIDCVSASSIDRQILYDSFKARGGYYDFNFNCQKNPSLCESTNTL